MRSADSNIRRRHVPRLRNHLLYLACGRETGFWVLYAPHRGYAQHRGTAEPDSRTAHEPGSRLDRDLFNHEDHPQGPSLSPTATTQELPRTAQHDDESFSRSSADRPRLGLGELRVEPKIAFDRRRVKGGPIVRELDSRGLPRVDQILRQLLPGHHLRLRRYHLFRPGRCQLRGPAIRSKWRRLR